MPIPKVIKLRNRNADAFTGAPKLPTTDRFKPIECGKHAPPARLKGLCRERHDTRRPGRVTIITDADTRPQV